MNVGDDTASDTESEYSTEDEDEASVGGDFAFTDYSNFIHDRTNRLAFQRETLTKQKLSSLSHYIVFRAISGPMRKERFLVTAPIAIIGRKDGDKTQNHSRTHQRLELRDRLISRANTIIEYKNGVYFVRDLKSRHGTFIKIQEGCEYKLEIGDVFQASHHEFTVIAKTNVKNSEHKSLLSECCSVS